MKRFLFSVILAFSLLTQTCIAHPTLKDTQRAAMHRIIMGNADDKSGCTAYAISEHVLLTAQHCDLPDGKLTIDDAEVINEVVERVFDNHDHMLLVIPSANFKSTISYDPSKYVPPVQGEHVYFWGNPEGLKDLYREGYVAGIDDEKVKEISVNDPFFLFVLVGGHGDSGAAIFASDGRLISVVTYGLNVSLMGGYSLAFTSGQIKQAISVK